MKHNMAMTPQEKTEFEEMKKTLASIVTATNVPFIESLRRRDGGAIKGDTLSATTAIIQSVNEAGSGTYSVAKAPDSKLEVQLSDGTIKFIGVYNS